MTPNCQKAVAGVQQNAPFTESRTPAACACGEIADPTVARYGDGIIVETGGKKIRVRRARLTPFMGEYHDSVIGSGMSRAEMDELNKKYENTRENPFNFPARSGIVSRTYDGLIHPIFMDQTSRKAVGVKPLEPVKVRRSLRRELRKKLNPFSGIGMLAVSVLIPHFIVMHGRGDLPPWLAPAALAPLIAFIIWGVLATKYETWGAAPKPRERLWRGALWRPRARPAGRDPLAFRPALPGGPRRPRPRRAAGLQAAARRDPGPASSAGRPFRFRPGAPRVSRAGSPGRAAGWRGAGGLGRILQYGSRSRGGAGAGHIFWRLCAGRHPLQAALAGVPPRRRPRAPAEPGPGTGRTGGRIPEAAARPRGTGARHRQDGRAHPGGGRAPPRNRGRTRAG